MGMTLLVEMRANPTAAFSGTQSLYDGSGTATMTAIAAPYVDHVSFECDATISGNLNSGSGSAVTAYLDGNEGTLELNAEI